MWDSVECLAEVKDDDIYLVSVVVYDEDVLEGVTTSWVSHLKPMRKPC